MSVRKKPLIAVLAILVAIAASYGAWRGWTHWRMQRERVVAARGIDRVRAIIASATPEHPKVLKVLFYGQSISAPAWTDLSIRHLTERYPNMRFVFRNMAIGAFYSGHLKDTVERDVTAFYPDLIVFHVYGSPRDYEEIIRLFRSRTAADVIVQTDHYAESPASTCDEGFHLTLRHLPYCNGRLFYRAASWDTHMSRDIVPQLAERYGLAVEPRRDEWAAYLRDSQLKYTDLLADQIHPNAAGWRLMADLFNRYFDREIAAKGPASFTDVHDLVLKPGDNDLSIVGNRVELVSLAPLPEDIRATVDQRAPRRIGGCWEVSRASPIPGTPWPAIRKISIDPAYLRADDWTARITAFDPHSRAFAFRVDSMRNGFEGNGTSDSDFVARSGSLKIGRDSWMLAQALDLPYLSSRSKRDIGSLVVSWRQRFVCGDTPAIQLRPGQQEWRRTIVTDLPNGAHAVHISIPATLPATGIRARIYRPPLHG